MPSLATERWSRCLFRLSLINLFELIRSDVIQAAYWLRAIETIKINWNRVEGIAGIDCRRTRE